MLLSIFPFGILLCSQFYRLTFFFFPLDMHVIHPIKYISSDVLLLFGPPFNFSVQGPLLFQRKAVKCLRLQSENIFFFFIVVTYFLCSQKVSLFLQEGLLNSVTWIILLSFCILKQSLTLPPTYPLGFFAGALCLRTMPHPTQSFMKKKKCKLHNPSRTCFKTTAAIWFSRRPAVLFMFRGIV